MKRGLLILALTVVSAHAGADENKVKTPVCMAAASGTLTSFAGGNNVTPTLEQIKKDELKKAYGGKAIR